MNQPLRLLLGDAAVALGCHWVSVEVKIGRVHRPTEFVGGDLERSGTAPRTVLNPKLRTAIAAALRSVVSVHFPDLTCVDPGTAGECETCWDIDFSFIVRRWV